jgi:hypothetical protein
VKLELARRVAAALSADEPIACALLVPRRDKLLRPWRRLRPQKLREA